MRGNLPSVDVSGLATRAYDWLFLDLNSYFASVEQQVNPALRGKPIIVVPVESDYTCAIAASYEAKKFGIKTGTPVREAKRACPGLICVPARHRLYVEYHEKILKEIERHVLVHHVASIDEVACRLTGSWREPETARRLALTIKAGIRKRVGECLTCSIGLSTNRLLAKLASDLQKPDGLQELHPLDLPDKYRGLELRDFCGIGPNRERRLRRAGLLTPLHIWHCPPKQFRAIWGSVEGERFWLALRGVEIPPEPTRKSCIGHSRVLDPRDRPSVFAEQVGRRLLLKAANRLRDSQHLTGALTLSLRVENGPRLVAERRFSPRCDSMTLLAIYEELWQILTTQPPLPAPARLKKISVTLHALEPVGEARQLEFTLDRPQPGAALTSHLPEEVKKRPPEPPRSTAVLAALAQAEDRRERLSQVMDLLNKRFGRDTVTLGLPPAPAHDPIGTKIAFNRVPDLTDFPRERPAAPAVTRRSRRPLPSK